ncbi:MAG: glycosyltransferase family 9 protein [Verrucomicrobia bacterium]|nr:glycosyltransferase family 9 protein [Verrucomicrobiota bacterium]
MLSLPDNPRILVIRGGAIGDFILTLPAIGALRQRWPSARLEILGYPRIAALADGRYYADAVRSIDAAAMARFFVPEADLDPPLSDYFASFDLVLSYLYDPDDIFSANLARAGVPHLFRASAKPDREHAATHFARPLAELGLSVEPPHPRIFPNAADRAFAEQFFTVHCPLSTAHSLVALHPGSGGEHKVWPADRWAAVIRWLREQHGRDILLIGGEADDAARRALAPFNLPVAWNLPLPQLAAVLERCALFAGHDSGITHLAAAVGIPTLALFGPTSPEIWSPRGPKVRVLASRGPIGDIAVESVLGVLRKMLAHAGSPPV